MARLIHRFTTGAVVSLTEVISTEALISRLASSLEPRFNRFPTLSSTNMPVNCQTPDSAYWGKRGRG